MSRAKDINSRVLKGFRLEGVRWTWIFSGIVTNVRFGTETRAAIRHIPQDDCQSARTVDLALVRLIRG